MKPGITFTNGEDHNRQHPESFHVPATWQKESIQPGDLVKIGIEDELDRSGNSGLTPERVWVRITQVTTNGFEGTVDNRLLSADYYGLHYGDVLSFEARHILDVETVDEQQMLKDPDGKSITVSLEDLTKRLPRVPLAKCELDPHTHIAIGRLANSFAVAAFLYPLELISKEQMALEAKALQTAAESLGLVPDELKQDDPKDICVFMLKMPSDIDGAEVLRRMRESIAAVRAEAKQLLSNASSASFVAGAETPTTADISKILTPRLAAQLARPRIGGAVEDCPQCQRFALEAQPIPREQITPAMAEMHCLNCRGLLPFELLDCPVSREEILALCEYVEDALETTSCDHTLRFAGEFCTHRNLPTELVLNWLREQGGYCDYEVGLNITHRLVDDSL